MQQKLGSLQKRAVRAFPAKTSWGTTRPLIGQAAHGRRAGIILLTAWQIRGRVVPHEVLAGNALTSPFFRANFCRQKFFWTQN